MEQVGNLDIGELSCRVLAIVPVWIVFAEQALIKQYKPIWNSCLDGFGKHHQGKIGEVRRNEVGGIRFIPEGPGRPGKHRSRRLPKRAGG